MALRVLLIEDDRNTVRVFNDAISARGIEAEVTVAASRGAAETQLEAFEFDLVVCDLKIPTVDDGLDAEVEHGLAAFEVAQQRQFGTPVLILSAFGTIEILEDVLARGRQDDPYGQRTLEQMLHHVRKSELTRGIEIVERAASEVLILEQIECRHDEALDWAELRLIRIFARKYGGTEVEVSELRGGLSGTKTLLIRVTDSVGAFKARGVMKLGPIERIEDESGRYDANVPAVLAEGVFVPRADVVRAGAGGRGGVVFTFADDHSDLYEVLKRDDPTAPGVIGLLIDRLQPWRNGLATVSRSVREVRALLVSDEEMEQVDIPEDIPLVELEQLELDVAMSIQHGDLHGANLLVDRDGNPKLIDFGRAGEGSSCLDAVSMELSLAFHPAGRDLCLPWPSVERISSWPDVDAYVLDCPVEAFVRRLRMWALDVSASEDQVVGTAYAFACRQLLFRDTDREKAFTLIRACARRLIRGE